MGNNRGEHTNCKGKNSRITEKFYTKIREFPPVFPGFEKMSGILPGFRLPKAGAGRFIRPKHRIWRKTRKKNF
jgi:hypothetical protein